MFAVARPRNIDVRPTARTDIARVLRCRGGAFGLGPIFREGGLDRPRAGVSARKF